MNNVLFKKHGKTVSDKLDWLLAIALSIISLGLLLLCIGVCMQDTYEHSKHALLYFLNGLIFVNNVEKYGQGAVTSAYTTIICYSSLLVLLIGSFVLAKRQAKGRIVGLVAQFIAALGLSAFICLINEYLCIHKQALPLIWPIILICFAVILGLLLICSIYLSFALDRSVSLNGEEVKTKPQPVEEKPHEEPKKEKEVVKEEAPAPLPVDEEVEEEEEAQEEAEEEEESDEVNPDDPFANLGKRKKRIPFEKKVKKTKPETRERYKTMVEELRKFDLNDRISIPGETFSYKKERLVFFAFSGNTLKVYFKLNPKQFENSTIPVKDVSEIKKYQDLPSCLIIKSDLASRRAISLAEQVFKNKKIKRK